VAVRVYTIPLSHAGLCAVGMLEQNGVEFREVSLPGGLHPVVLRALGFRGATVPAMRWSDGSRVQGSRAIAAALHEHAPERELFPADPAARARVEAAERWGEEVMQPIPRRLIRRGLRDHLRQRQWFADVASPFPAPRITGAVLTPLVPLFIAQAGATPARVAQDLAELPALLDRVDELLADGTIGGPRLNAADWQIGTTVRMLLAFEDVAVLVAGRPAEAHARRVQPVYPTIPAALPSGRSGVGRNPPSEGSWT
jgi:glutathione S-transferase